MLGVGSLRVLTDVLVSGWLRSYTLPDEVTILLSALICHFGVISKS